MISSISGANIRVSDGDTIIADTGTTPGMLGVLNPATGTVNLSTNVTASTDDPTATVRGINIEGNGSILFRLMLYLWG